MERELALMKQDENSLDNYKVIIDTEVFDQIHSIQNYIANTKFNPLAADKLVKQILDDLAGLEVFPERGFLVSERFGKNLSKKTSRDIRGLVIGNRNYLAFYTVDKKAKVVKVAMLVSKNTDWISLFL